MPTVVVDFTDSEGGGRVRIPEDDYRVKIKEIAQKESKSGNQMLVFTFVITQGKHKGKELRDYFPLTKEAAWKLRQVLEATGASVPAKKSKIRTEKYEGEELGATVADEEYNNKIGSKIQDYISLDVLDDADVDVDEDDEDEEPQPKAKKGKKNKKGKKSKKDDDDEDVEELDLDEI